MSPLSDGSAPLSSRLASPKSLSRIVLATMLASTVACALFGIAYVRETGAGLIDAMTKSVYDWYWVSIANIVSIEMTAVSMIILAIRNHRGDVRSARYMTRVLVVLIIATALLSVVVNGITWFLVAYVIQLVCVVAYQVANDPNLGEDAEWSGLGWDRKLRSAFAAPFASLRLSTLPDAEYEKIEEADVEDEYRDRYIPLNGSFCYGFLFPGELLGHCL